MAKSDVFIQVSDYEETQHVFSGRSFVVGGRVTVVEFVRPSDGAVVGTGYAVRNPQDAPDPELGHAIAYERAAYDLFRRARRLRTKIQHAHN